MINDSHLLHLYLFKVKVKLHNIPTSESRRKSCTNHQICMELEFSNAFMIR